MLDSKKISISICYVIPYDLKVLNWFVTCVGELAIYYTFKTLFVFAFYGFFRLESLLSSSVSTFNPTRYPWLKDLVSVVPDI